jgi:hypothetical protein
LRAESQRNLSMRARMQIKQGPRPRTEVNYRAPVEKLKDYYPIFNERRERDCVGGVIAQAAHLLARSGENVKTFPQALPEEKDLYSGLIAKGRWVLAYVAVTLKRSDVTVYGGL